MRSYRTRTLRSVDDAIAVVIDSIHDFRRIRVDRCIGVIAVGVTFDVPVGLVDCRLQTRHRIRAPRGITEGVPVTIDTHENQILIDTAIAVIVCAVARLRCARIHAHTRVIAIRVVHHVSSRSRTRIVRHGSIAVAIAVVVQVERELYAFIRSAVAVVVHAVARLGRSGVNRTARVVTVRGVNHVPSRYSAAGTGRACAVPVPIAVVVQVVSDAEAVVHHAIAVVVVAVANLGFARIQTGITVIAIIADLVAIGIVVAVVRGARTVVVLPVAPFDVPGVDVVVRVVTVRGVCRVARRLRAVGDADGCVAVAIVVRITVPIQRIHGTVVHAAIAVVVHAVADLELARVDARVAVVAVRVVRRGTRRRPVARAARHGRIPVPVAIRVRVVAREDQPFVRAAVAVVVHIVAAFAFRRVDVRVAVIAVRGVGAVAGTGIRTCRRCRTRTVPVDVGIHVVINVGDVVVHDTVAVVVHPVAAFARAGAHGTVAVVAIRVVRRSPCGRKVARIERGRGIAVAVRIRIHVPREHVHRVAVHVAVAVVVELVAHLRVAGVARRFRVVAIIARLHAVAVCICGAERAITIQVDARRTVFHGVRVHSAIRVVAVGAVRNVPSRSRAVAHRCCHVAVAVAVHICVVRGLVHRVAVDRGVAVVVHAVTDFRGTRVNRRVRIIAVVAGREAVAVVVDGSRGVVRIRIGIRIRVGVRIGIGVAVAIRVRVRVGVRIGVRVRVGIGIRVGVGVSVSVGIRVGVAGVVGVDHAGFPGRVAGIATVVVDRDGAAEPPTGRLRTVVGGDGASVEHESEKRRGNKSADGHDVS